MISIITPCKNIVLDSKRQKFFNCLLKSIRNQTFKEVEHIIIDGDSQDGTKEFLESVSKQNLIRFISESDNGVYQAMNKGILMSKGKYIIIINSDDYFIDNSYLEQAILILENSPEIDYVHANKLITNRYSLEQSVKNGNELETFYRMPFRHNTIVVRKNIINYIGLFDESYKIVSDYKFILKLILSGKKGMYLNLLAINSLDGGLSSNRELCITEVSLLLYKTYGEFYGLTLDDCKKIYLREFSLDLVLKLKNNIKNSLILESLLYGINRYS